MIFEEYFKFPFQCTCIDIEDANYHKVADWLHGFLSILAPDAMELSETDRQHVVDCINGNYVIKNNHNFKYDQDKGLILCDDRPCLRIRGWGYLIGTGGCNLSSERAFEIQNDLANYIVNQLNNTYAEKKI